jgi:hypothetical protein
VILDIDGDVLAAVETLAAERGDTVDETISRLAGNELARMERLFRNGVPTLPRRDAVVTPEFVESLLDEIDSSDAALAGDAR